jgi:predicted nucleotidyltransferase
MGTIVPIMGTLKTEIGGAGALFGKVRSAVLALLFSHADQSFYLREIARAIGTGHGAVQRELAQLLKAGLVTRYRRGREVFYQANRASPVFPELHGLIVKTVGVADVLREALAPLAERVRVAFIYGSFAKGEERAESDVDIMVVGDVDFGEVVSALRPAQDRIGREVNPSVFAPEEWRRRVAGGDHFITTIQREEKLFLIGDEQDLRGLV